ncbi:MAG TPA: phage portal protein [Devosia sp.]|jgi:HK97 family phage portal protein|nr:phage portal protein [Devosia sp.]
MDLVRHERQGFVKHLLSYFRPPFGIPVGSRADVGGSNWAGKPVTVDSVMQLATAWACIRLNARTIGSLPRKVYERTATNSRADGSGHDLYRILHDSPNADQTAMEFWEGQATWLNLRGNAYAEKHLNFAGNKLVALTPIEPDFCRPYRAKDGTRRYKVTDLRRQERDLGEDQVFHLRGFGSGGLEGLSPIAFGRQTMASSIAAEEAAARTFSSGLALAGFVESATGIKLKEGQREEIAALFERYARSDKRGKVLPLDPGMSFKSMTMNPEDAQLLETRRFQTEEIARWFGVPPILIGHAAQGQTMFGSGVEQIMLAWLSLSLAAELERIEQAIEKQLLFPVDRGRFYVEHNIESLLRADSAARAALWASASQNGWMDRNEIRSKENLDRREGAGELTAQSNLMPIAMLGRGDGQKSIEQAIADIVDQRIKAHPMNGHNGGPPLRDGE